MKKVMIGLSVLLACGVMCPTFAHAFQKEKGTYTVDSSGCVAAKKDKPVKTVKVKKVKNSKK